MNQRVFILFEWKAKVLFSFLAGCFLFLVLFVYQGYQIPQELSYSGHSLLFRSFIFAMATIALLSFLELVIGTRLQKIVLNSPLYQILWLISELLLETLIVFVIFNVFWNWVNLSWGGYFKFMLELAGVLFIPFVISWFYQKTLSKLSSLDLSLNERAFFTFHSNNSKEQLSISNKELLYIKSEDNYVKVVFSNSGNLKNRLLRNTLSMIEDDFKHDPFLIRCHRSYIVNLQNVKEVYRRNGQLTLHFGRDQDIPVSNTFRESIEQQLKQFI